MSPQPESPTVSVIITNYNGRKFLGDCIDSALAQTLKPLEILVVDNASDDGSVELVHTRYPEVTLVQTGENMGFGRAANAGIRESKGAFIALLNNDAVADAYWLERLLEQLIENEEIGLCASRMLFSWDKKIVNNAGVGMTDYGLPYDRGFYLADGEAFASNRLVFGACGGAAMLRRTMLERTGLFDEDFFLCYDDADLSFRAQLIGYRCMYVADAIVYHAGGGTVPHHGKTARYYSCRHFVAVTVKNMPGTILYRRLGAITWFCLKNAIRSIFEHKDLTNLRGYCSGLANIRRNLKLRKEIQNTLAVTPEYVRSLLVSKRQMLSEISSGSRPRIGS